MQIENRIVEAPVNSLKPDPKQPRKTFPEEVIENIAKTIKAHGTINPIEVDEKNVIVTGEIRWKGARLAGVKTVPTRRIKSITPQERLERQLIENLHHTELESKEREDAIYRLWKTGRFKSHRELAETLGYHHATIGDIIEAKEFRDKAVGLPDTVPTSLISETKELDKKTRVELLKKVARGEIRRPAPQTEVREAVKILKKAPEPIKGRFLRGEIPQERAKKIVEVYEKAPEPLKKAVEKEEVKLEHAEEAISLYKELEEEGVKVEESKIKQHVEELKKEARMDEAQAKLRREAFKDVLAGRKEAIDVTIMDRGATFIQEVRDVAWKVKGWGVPTLMEIGAERWREAQRYFKQVRDHMDFLLGHPPP